MSSRMTDSLGRTALIPGVSVSQVDDNELRTRLLSLPDGRDLAWAEYGHRHGFPVIYFPSQGGTRLEARLLHDAAMAAGFRLISIDRPGLGLSSFNSQYSHCGVAADVAQLLNELNIKQTGLLAWAGGAPFALAFASCYPDLVRLVSLMSPFPVVPGGQSRIVRMMLSVYRRYIQVRHARSRTSIDTILSRWKDGLCYADQKQLDNPWVYRVLRDNALEALRSGGKGVSWDSALSFMAWDFNPASVKAPVQLWQGGADNFSAPNDALRLQSLLPGALLHTVARQGHLFFLGVADDVFRNCRQVLANPPA